MTVGSNGTHASPRTLLNNGDRMNQGEFHQRYLSYPKQIKIELIGGIVHMPSPTSFPHGQYLEELGFLMGVYRRATGGVSLVPDTTTILNERSEPRPDLLMRIEANCGGQSRVNADRYLEGAPELIAEIALSSRAIDLNQKRDDYETAGVREYIVVDVEELTLIWFDFVGGEPIRPNRQGISRSRVFPGLWIHIQALLDLDSEKWQPVLQQGLASREHTAFVKRLAKRRASS